MRLILLGTRGHRCIAFIALVILLVALAPSAAHAQEGVGLYQNDYFAVVYTGQWVFFNNAQASGGSLDYTDDETANVSFTFNANTITLYRTLGPSRAIMRVLIDGAPVGPSGQNGKIDNYSSTVRYAVPYRVTGLSQGIHTVKIEHAGERNPDATGNMLDIDAFEVDNLTAVQGGLYENNHQAFSYAGGWLPFDTAAASGGSVHYTNQKDAAAYLVFSDANAVRIGYTKNSFMGMLEVYIDGTLVHTLNCYNPSAQWQVSHLLSGINANQQHVLEIRNNGQRDILSSDTYTYVDWVEVITNYQTPAPTATATGQVQGRYENDRPGAFTYHGSWFPFSNALASGNSVHVGNIGGDRASIVLYGNPPTGANTIEIGYTQIPWGGIFEVYVDYQLRATIDTYGPSQWQKSIIVTPVGLFAPHVIEIVNTGQKGPYSSGSYVYLDWVELKYYNTPAPTATKIPYTSDARLEDSNQLWDWYGSWQEYINPNASGSRQSVRYTNVFNDRGGVVVRINNAPGALEVGYTQNTFMGIFEVYVDDQRVAIVDGYGPVQWQKTVVVGGLTAATHVVTIRSTGAKNASATGTYVYLDWIRIINAYTTPPPSPTPSPVYNGTYEDTHDAWVWNGAWSIFSNASASGGSVKWTGTAGNTATLRIDDAEAIAVGYTQNTFMGVFEVYVDGDLVATIDGYGPITWKKEAVIPGLTTDYHIVTIRNTGTKNSASSGTYLYLDYLRVIGTYIPPTATHTPSPPYASGKIEDSDTRWVYHGVWSPFSTTFASGGSVRTTNTAGSIAGITVSGAQAVEIGYTELPWGGIVEVYANAELVGTIDAYNSASQWQVTRIVMLPSSPTGQHTIDIRITGQKNVASSDAYFYLDWLRALTSFTPTNTPVPTYRGIGRYETDNPAVTMSRAWILYANASLSGGKAHYTNWSDATATLYFDGLWVEIRFFTGLYYGMFDVYIDGVFVHRVDGYGETGGSSTYTARAPNQGQHKLEVRTSTLKNPLANGTYTMLDYLEVLDVDPTLTPTPTITPTPRADCRTVNPSEVPDTVRTDPDAIFVSCAYAGSSNGSFDRPYHTIAEALDVAENGKKVYVLPGTYDRSIGEFQIGSQTGSLTFGASSVQLISTHGRDFTVIDASELEAPVFEVSSYTGLLIDGFMIVNGDAAQPGAGGGIYVHDAGSVTIRNNEFWGNKGGAIGVTEQGVALIEGNLIHHNENSINYPDRDASIMFTNPLSGGYIVNNQIYDNNQTAIRVAIDNSPIARNHIFRNTPPVGEVSAIDATYFASNRIENNVIYRNVSSGTGSATIALGDDPAILANNTIAYNSDANTILFTASGTVVLFNNAITHNSGTAVMNCIYVDALYNNNIWGNATNYGTGCDSYRQGENDNLSTNPYYYNATEDDYHIHVYPQGMMNKGDANPAEGLFAPTHDYDDFWFGEDGSPTGALPRTPPAPPLGDARSMGGSPDIGADEVNYDPTAVPPTNTPTPTTPPVPPGAPPGTYEEDYTGIQYAGSWAIYPTTGASGGAMNWTAENGAQYQFQFAGNQIEILYARCATCGTFEVWLDNELIDLVNSYSATLLLQQSYALITTYDSHTLKVVNVGTNWLGLDALRVAIATPITDGMHEDSEAGAFYFTADWVFYSPAQGSGTVHYTTDQNARARVYFTGGGFTLNYFTKGSWAGKFDIYVDGVRRQTVDQYDPVQTYGHSITISDLETGNHILEIRHAGKNASSSGYYIFIDFIQVLP